MDLLYTAPPAAPSAAPPGANGRVAPADTALTEAMPVATPCFAGLLSEACAALDAETPSPEGAEAAAEALAAVPEEGSLLSLMQAPAAPLTIQPQQPISAPSPAQADATPAMPGAHAISAVLAGIAPQPLASPLGEALAAPALATPAESAPQTLSLAEAPAPVASIGPDGARVTPAEPPVAETGASADLMASLATPEQAAAAAHVINAPASGAVPAAEANVAPALLGTAAQAMASAALPQSKSPAALPQSKSPAATTGAKDVAPQPAGPRDATRGISVDLSAIAAPSLTPEVTPASQALPATIPAALPQDLNALIAGLAIVEPPMADLPAQGRIGADPVSEALPAAAPAAPAPGSVPATPVIASPPRAAVPVAWPARQIAPFAVALALGPNASLTVTLDPLELGRVEVSIERSGTEAAIRVVAERPETLALLQRDAKELQRALSDAGISQTGTSLSFSLGNGGASQQEARHGAARRDAAPLLASGLPASLSKSFLAPHQAADQRGLLDLAV